MLVSKGLNSLDLKPCRGLRVNTMLALRNIQKPVMNINGKRQLNQLNSHLYLNINLAKDHTVKKSNYTSIHATSQNVRVYV